MAGTIYWNHLLENSVICIFLDLLGDFLALLTASWNKNHTALLNRFGNTFC